MQNIFHRLVSQLKAKGEPNASEIAKRQMVRSGNMTPGGELTPKGLTRSAMGAAGRAKDRAAEASNGRHSAADYLYSSRTNRATLK